MSSSERDAMWAEAVNIQTYNTVLSRIRELNNEDRDEPITLYITSSGGSMKLAFGFYDFINSVWKIRLHTVVVGHADSAAVILFLAGTERSIAQNASMIFHQPEQSLENAAFSPEELKFEAESGLYLRERYTKIVSECSDGKLQPDDVEAMMREGKLLLPDEAKELNLAHEIL